MRQFTLSEAAAALAQNESDAALTIHDVIRAVDMLKAANVPAHDDGYYVARIGPWQWEDMQLWTLVEGRSYRVEQTALAILDHERRRWALGKQANITARDALDRALRLEER
jgi:hypothetical protein